MASAAKAVPSKKSAKMTYAEFVTQAIITLRTSKSKGIHSVYSGFNAAFMKYFEFKDKTLAFATIDALEEQGVIGTRFCRRGKMLYLPGEAPAAVAAGSNALAAILGGTKAAR